MFFVCFYPDISGHIPLSESDEVCTACRFGYSGGGFAGQRDMDRKRFDTGQLDIQHRTPGSWDAYCHGLVLWGVPQHDYGGRDYRRNAGDC